MLLGCNNASCELVQVDEDGQQVTLSEGQQWNFSGYPTLLVTGEENAYGYDTDIRRDQSISVVFQPDPNSDSNSRITISPRENGFALYNNGKLEISGTGTLIVHDPGKDDIFSNHDSFLLDGGQSNSTPTVDIFGTVNLVFEARRGISVDGGTFTYECPEGDIFIGGGQDGPYIFEGGLLTGIMAAADSNDVASDIDIFARTVTIYSGAANENSNSTELISTTARGSDYAYYYNRGDVSIKINTEDALSLVVSPDSKPSEEFNGFGIYSQAGRLYSSEIYLSGNSFVIYAPADGWYGIYMLDYGEENHVSLSYTDSIRFIMDSNAYGIYGIRLLADSIDKTTVDLIAGREISLSNESSAMVYNVGELFNISAPTISIRSGGSFALWTDYYRSGSSEAGITNVKGETISIVSTGTDENSYGVVTTGNPNLSKANGFTTIEGNTITIYSENMGTLLSQNYAIATVTGKQVALTSQNGFAIGTLNSAASTVKGETVVVSTDALPYVVYTEGQGSVTTVNYEADTQSASTQTTQVKGRLLAINQGVTNIGFSSSISEFNGSTDDGAYFEAQGEDAFASAVVAEGESKPTAGSISLYANNGSVWKVQPNPMSVLNTEEVNGVMNRFSNLSHYHSYGLSFIDLTTPDSAQDLDIVNLTGNSAAFWLRTYIDEQRITGGSGDETQIRDHVNILKGNGQHYILMRSSGLGYPYPEQKDYLVWSREPNTLYILNPKTGETEGTPGQDNLSFRLGVLTGTNSVDRAPYVQAISKIDLGVYNYFLTTRDKAHDGIDMEGVEFFLSRGDSPEYSPSTELDRTLAGFGSEYAIWWAELSDLRKRLGEVRYGAQDGPWVRFITQKDDIAGVGAGRFTQKMYGINLGFDHIATQDEDRMWLLGGNIKYANANQKIKHSRYGRGDIHDWGMNLYATYANQFGCYSDLVLTLDRYDRKAKTHMLDQTPVHGKWHNYGAGASIEVGKMFSSTQDDEGWGPWYNHWWIEPQAQLAYYHVFGKNFTLSNGMKTDQGDIDFLTGRLGVVIGKKFNYGKDRAVVDKRYSQFYVKGGIKHEFLGNQKLWVSDGANRVGFKGSLRGTRVYYGAGFDWNFTDQLRLYAQFERESGGKYKKDYEISAGLKWQF